MRSVEPGITPCLPQPSLTLRRLPWAAAGSILSKTGRRRSKRRPPPRQSADRIFQRGKTMERIWLKQYPAGVPADIDTNQYSSLVELLEESFAKYADRKAFICMDKAISYRDLDEMSMALGAYLQSRGLSKGARVA